MFLDWLNEGSCFCIYTAFTPEQTQLVNFRASTSCLVYMIDVNSLRKMEKKFIQISDNFKTMEIDIMKGEKTDLDFFRFMPPRVKVLSH